jgi:hypothetical protein
MAAAERVSPTRSARRRPASGAWACSQGPSSHRRPAGRRSAPHRRARRRRQRLSTPPRHRGRRLGRGGTSRSATTRTRRRRRPATFLESRRRALRVPGDFARVEEDGTVTLLGRGSNSASTPAARRSTPRRSRALKGHPDVFDALVVGVPDEKYGQRVAAVVQPREGASPDLEELRRRSCARPRRLQAAAQALWWSTRSAQRQPARPTTPRSTPRSHRRRQPSSGKDGLMRTELCDRFGIDYPIFASPRPSTSPRRSAGPAGSACSAACGSTTPTSSSGC